VDVYRDNVLILNTTTVAESNNVYALNATNGTIIWQRNLGTPVPLNRLGCGNIRVR